MTDNEEIKVSEFECLPGYVKNSVRSPWYNEGSYVDDIDGQTVTLNHYRSHIVKCVNLHEELVEALQMSYPYLDTYDKRELNPRLDEAMNRVESVLKRVKEFNEQN